MPYSSWVAKTTADTNAAADVNLLADTIYTYIKGGLSTVQPVITLDTMPRGEMRQTVLNASVSSSDGYPNYIARTSTVAIQLGASTTDPVVISFSNGINEYLVKLSSNVAPAAWAGFSTNATWYLYVDYLSSDGSVSYGVSSLAPNYFWALESTAATAGRHTFIVPKMKMYYDDGSSWTNYNRVFVGEVEVTTGGISTNSTTVRNYALRGTWRKGWTAISTATNYQWFHNVGVPVAQGLSIEFYFSTLTSSQADLNSDFAHDIMITSGGTAIGHWAREASTSYDTRDYIKLGFPSGGVQYWQSTTALNSGYYDCWIKRKW